MQQVLNSNSTSKKVYVDKVSQCHRDNKQAVIQFYNIFISNRTCRTIRNSILSGVVNDINSACLFDISMLGCTCHRHYT